MDVERVRRAIAVQRTARGAIVLAPREEGRRSSDAQLGAHVLRGGGVIARPFVVAVVLVDWRRNELGLEEIGCEARVSVVRFCSGERTDSC